jgi:hypothetical protein
MKTFLKKSVQRLARSLDGPTSTFSEQFLYGHREVLICASGISPYLALRGSVQHGWVPFEVDRGIPRFYGGHYLHLAWSEASYRRTGQKPKKSTVFIGAPFLYLLKMLELQDLKRTERERKYLFFPPHGTENDSPHVDTLIENYARKFNPNESTVQLYWVEFLDSEVRNRFLEAGFRIETAGFSGLAMNEGIGISSRAKAVSVLGQRHLFLINLLKTILQHDVVVCGTFGSSSLYAGFLGKPVVLLDSWNSYESSFIHGKSAAISSDFFSSPMFSFIKEQVVPVYFDENGESTDRFSDFCARELGEHHVMTSGDMGDLLAKNSFMLNSDLPVKEVKFAIEHLKKVIE